MRGSTLILVHQRPLTARASPAQSSVAQAPVQAPTSKDTETRTTELSHLKPSHRLA